MFNQVEFKKTRDFGETINDTFKFIKQNFKPLIRVFFYLCGFFLLATLISSAMQQIGMQNILRTPSASDPFRAITALFSLQYLVTVTFTFANYTAISVSALSFIALYVEKGNVAPTVEQVWAYFKYYYFRALAGNFLISLFALICAIPCGTVLIYVFPAISIFLPIMIFENASLTYSFNRSFKLIKDNWGVTAGSLLIIWLITSATSSLASLPAMILSVLGALSPGGQGLSNTVIIFSTIIQCLCQVFLILPVVAASLCYFNLRERHENTGLLGRINTMGETKEKPDFTGEY